MKSKTVAIVGFNARAILDAFPLSVPGDVSQMIDNT